MKRCICVALIFTLLLMLFACKKQNDEPAVVATTLPVYEFAAQICINTPVQIQKLITENISCLHEYTLQVEQMRMIESADLILISGAGLEDFLNKALVGKNVIDASIGVELRSNQNEGHESEHQHEQDPHIWLSPKNAIVMSMNIYDSLVNKYPQYKDIFSRNLDDLILELDKLHTYGRNQLSTLSCRKLVTFHEGFSYFADNFSLEIAHSIEEESGREASAGELKEIIHTVDAYSIPAIFTEKNGSTSAAEIISNERKIPVYSLDMAISGDSYFTAMYANIDIIKEALG